MKQLNLPNLFFYFFMLFFLLTKIDLLFASQNSLCQLDYQSKKKIIKDNSLANYNILFLIEALRIIKRSESFFGIRNKVESKNDEDDNNDEDDKDFIHDILIVLIGTYQKVISATITYYLMNNFSNNQNLHESVALILAQDFVSIVKIISSQSIKIFMNPIMKWEKKLYYSLGLVVAIVLIKSGIDAIPQKEKTEKESLDDAKLNKKEASKIACLSVKFNNYK